ncbi:MAG: endonuclease/exonuclease/phosphatase family protein, partial [Congregibacter sp.]|nr:endonuclease/exonuclease/phosphatase family protein [Congregibacter sp.]
ALQTAPATSLKQFPAVLRMLSWNVMKFDLPGSREQLNRLAAHTDLLLLQESLRSADTPKTGGSYRYFSPGYARGSEQTGVEVRSGEPADVVCELRFVEPWLRTPKASLAIRLPFRDAALLLINLHAINFTLTTYDYASQLSELAQLVNSHPGPVIIAGDFNHWNTWRAAKLQRWAEDLSLTEVTFALDWRSRHLGARVDTIFLRGLSVIAEAALPTTRSDHHPITASLELLKNSEVP